MTTRRAAPLLALASVARGDAMHLSSAGRIAEDQRRVDLRPRDHDADAGGRGRPDAPRRARRSGEEQGPMMSPSGVLDPGFDT